MMVFYLHPPPTEFVFSQINHLFSTSTGWRKSNQWAVESDDWGIDLNNITASFRLLCLPVCEYGVPLNLLEYNTAKYEMKKQKLVQHFFVSLKKHPSTLPLPETVKDPDVPTITKPRLYYVIFGPPNPVKLHVLNYCLLVFSVIFVKKGYKIKDISNLQIFADV